MKTVVPNLLATFRLTTKLDLWYQKNLSPARRKALNSPHSLQGNGVGGLGSKPNDGDGDGDLPPTGD